MKRHLLMILIAILILGVAACGEKKKYVDEIATLNTVAKEANKLAWEVSHATNRIAFGKAVVDFVRNYRTVKPEMAKLESLYPNLKITGGAKNAPKELKPHIKEMVAALKHMWVVIKGKTTKWAQDEAIQNLSKDVKEILYYY